MVGKVEARGPQVGSNRSPTKRGSLTSQLDSTWAENMRFELDDFLCRALELHLLAPDAWFCDGVAYPKLAWLSSDLLPKLVRWATECQSSEFRSTLSLLPVEKYSLVYQQLKEKYKAMVKVQSLVSLFNRSTGLILLTVWFVFITDTFSTL